MVFFADLSLSKIFRKKYYFLDIKYIVMCSVVS